MRRHDRRDGVRRPAGFVATRHSGGTGAPPGTTTSPCQELADDLISRDPPFEADQSAMSNLKRGPVFAKSPRNEHALWCAACAMRFMARSAVAHCKERLLAHRKAPAASPKRRRGTPTWTALFGAPSPSLTNGGE